MGTNSRKPLVVLDASWYMPQEKRNPLEEYQLPHMLPLEEAFAAAVSVLGIQNTDSVIIYDGKGLFSAPRVWWTFRIFGHNKVWVLNGGLPHWLKAGYEVEATTPENVTLRATAVRKAIKSIYHGQYVKQNMTDKTHQLLDARSKGRFDGVAPEPREGIKSGHIPESKCVPFTEGLHRLGKLDVPVYDGSWTEWATQPGNPIHTLATD
ncbi:hypothetical protein ZIOFF_010825 [Zingiber officinale]|uniref:Sulfurtransferase n=1 Tax=Zingiber officinale TaxID=94328 RepID=A0A8J5HJB6_ZINOF|nr:hypothetical protein ZIOFF_010825 [Zingiber officinale]